MRILMFIIVLSVFWGYSQDLEQSMRDKRCFDKSLERIGQRFVDWECGQSAQIVDCNEVLESDPGSNLILHRRSGKPFSGQCETCHMNGIRERIVQMENGKVSGTDETYYPSGCLQVIRTHINGLENGTWKYYNDTSGLEAWEINYMNGEKHGKSVYFRQFKTGEASTIIQVGNTTQTIRYNTYDTDTSRIEYFNIGKLHGKRKEYFTGNRVKNEANYQNGLLHGASIIYDPDGKILQELNYFQGKRDGVQKHFFEDGTLLKIENWSKGVKSGEFKMFYIQGHIQTKEVYNKKGQRHGVWEERYPDDKVKRLREFRKDVLISERVFDEYGNEIRTIGVDKPTGTDEDDAAPTTSKKKKKEKKPKKTKKEKKSKKDKKSK
jgi:antitoxin component YwqK of YwqJK toxin-antitoxin module